MYKHLVLILTFCFLASTTLADERVDEERPMNPDGRIDFSAVTGEYRITGSDDDRLVITGTLGTDVREFSIEGDETSWSIKLHPVEHQGRMPRRGSSSQLAISVPRGVEFEATTVSGAIEAADLEGRQVSLVTVSGSVQLNGVAPDRLALRTVSGGQRMDAGGLQDSRLRTVSGDIDARNLTGRVDVNSVSGGIKLDGSEVEQLVIETVSGRATVDLKPAANARYRVASHSGHINLTLPAETPLALRANTFSGRIRSDFGGEVRRGRGPGELLEHQTDGANVQLETKSFSGNIDIRRSDR